MLAFVLQLLLVGGTQAGFYGYVYSYETKDFREGNVSGDSFGVIFCVLIVSVTPLHFKQQGTESLKLSFSSCEEVNSWLCGDHCDNVTFTMNKVEESSGEWCQKEIITNWDKANFTSYQHE